MRGNSFKIKTFILFQILNGYITYVRISTAKDNTPGDKQLEDTNRNKNEKLEKAPILIKSNMRDLRINHKFFQV